MQACKGCTQPPKKPIGMTEKSLDGFIFRFLLLLKPRCYVMYVQKKYIHAHTFETAAHTLRFYVCIGGHKQSFSIYRLNCHALSSVLRWLSPDVALMSSAFRTPLSNSDVFFFLDLPVTSLNCRKVALSSDPVKHLGKCFFF